MKINLKQTLLTLAVLSATGMASAAPVTQFPYNCTFEDSTENVQWTVKKRTSVVTTWVVGGTAVSYMGQKSMYASADGGVTANYVDGAPNGYYSIAYREFTLAAGQYDLSYLWRAGGGSTDKLAVALVPTSLTPTAGAMGSGLPPYMTDIDNPYSNGLLSGKTSWTEEKQTITITTAGTYNLVFLWLANGDGATTNPAACIDNVQMAVTPLATDCHAAPTNLAMTNVGAGMQISWTGNATSYELQYFRSGDVQAQTVTGITANTYTVPRAQLTDGIYSFCVRSTCASDTSMWVYKTNMLVYDPTAHCIDFLNFTAPGVTCTYGPYTTEFNPSATSTATGVFQTTGVIDYGYESNASRHTIHYVPGETDPRTNGQLPTVPAGGLASVRIGNWDAGGYGQTVSYTVPVDSSMGVLQLRYAVVAESGGHDAAEQPIFYLRILDASGQVINGNCGVADFRPPSTVATAGSGWHVGNASDVFWREWTTVGINLQSYIGQSIRIQLISAGCVYSVHWGYAYFTLDCSDGKLTGVTCGEKPRDMTVDDGFNYRWYKPYNSTEPFYAGQNPTSRTLHVEANDSNTYFCDLISVTDASCYFTLQASALARLPKARATLTPAPHDCINEVAITNNSGIFGYFTSGGQELEVDMHQDCESYLWDFGSYGTSTSKTPTLIVPNEGDTVHATLYVGMQGDACTDSLSIELFVPAIGDTVGTDTRYMCDGDTAYFHGKAYTTPGFYVDSLTTYAGCDSLLTFELKVLYTDTIQIFDTICSYDTYTFYGVQYDTTGVYTHNVPSVLVPCDSLLYELHLTVLEALDMAIDYQSEELCSGDFTIHVPYEVYSGAATAYDLLFDQAAKNVGFVDVLAKPVLHADTVHIDIASDVWAGTYTATLVFHNDECGNKEFPVSFSVYYNADSLITQRWNDFLSVRKTAYDRYGGFSNYQWYRNDILLEGETGTQLYLPQERLGLTDEYAVELTRVADGVRMRTCVFMPVLMSDGSTLAVTPTRVRAAQSVHVQTTVAGTARLLTQMGLLVREMPLLVGDNVMPMPAGQGIYLLETILDNGQRDLRKIVVE